MTDKPEESRSAVAPLAEALVQPAPGGGSTGSAPSPHPSYAMKHRARHEFDSWAHTYDRSIVRHLLFRPAYRMFMEELYRWRRDIPDAFDLLDIGSGTGTWTAMVAGSPMLSRRIVGLDYSARMCSVAHGKAKQIGDGAPEFVNGDAEHLPFADGLFDVVTCSHSFHHYPHQAETIREMHRVLRTGGRLMLIDGFRDNVIGWVVFDVLITRGESTPDAKVHHPSWSVMRRYFEDAGFRDIRQRKTSIWAPIFLTIGVV
ncbi:MAG: methyltransferase domain-containing protein [Phycisphaerae bacterium]|nr:methyltransferase domain-containing protein [Phycisphaerae bacterium]